MAAVEVVMLGTASFLSKTISYQSMLLESTLWRSIRGGSKADDAESILSAPGLKVCTNP